MIRKVSLSQTLYLVFFCKSSFSLIEFMESLENQYDDISAHRQSVEIRKISVKFPHNETLNIPYQIHFELDLAILLTLSRFSIFSRVKFWKT